MPSSPLSHADDEDEMIPLEDMKSPGSLINTSDVHELAQRDAGLTDHHQPACQGVDGGSSSHHAPQTRDEHATAPVHHGHGQVCRDDTPMPVVGSCVGTDDVAGATHATPPPATVTTLKDLFQWPGYVLSQCAAQSGLPVATLATHFTERVANTTFSSAFSGIGGLETSMGCLTSWAAMLSGAAAAPALQRVHAVEFLPEPMTELQHLPDPPRCLFGDITNFLQPAMNTYLE